jgi:uncharacterized protein with gpF-like domain
VKGYVRYIMKEYRKKLTPRQRAASIRKAALPSTFRYPHKYERSVYAKARNTLSAYVKKVVKFVEWKYPRRTADSRTDDFATEFELFLRGLEAEYEEALQGMTLQIDLSEYFERVAQFILKFDQNEFAAYMKDKTGVPFYGTIEWWDEVKNAWIRDAVARITGTVTKYYEDVRSLVLDAIRSGTSYEEIVARLMKLDSTLTEKRAEFLARDLVGKLNGTIEQKLQSGLGIGNYFWQTAADERVRGRPGGRYPDALPSHWSMDSLVCDWSNPNIVSFDYGRTWVPRSPEMPNYHPGMDWQCRCRGTPFLVNLLKQLDAEIAREEL